jgi:hypothetical protein
MSENWFEVWTDDTTEPPYVLLVLSSGLVGGVRVFDVRESKVVLEASTYEEAQHWLSEDEYRRVTGRMER